MRKSIKKRGRKKKKDSIKLKNDLEGKNRGLFEYSEVKEKFDINEIRFVCRKKKKKCCLS